MTGLDRLRELAACLRTGASVSLWWLSTVAYSEAHGLDCRNTGPEVPDVLREIADQIEAEQEERITRRMEDREAAEWVRAHGGLEAVRERWEGRIARAHVEHMAERQRERRERMQRHIEYIQRLCRERRERIGELNREIADMRPRLMPEGCEWPRYESGEPVPIGGEFMGKDGKTYTAKQIQFIGKCFSLFDFCDRKPQFSGFYGERVRRPAVLAADGEPIEVGQTVYNVNDGTEYEVGGIRDTADADGDLCKIIECSNDELHIYYVCLPPDKLTHQRPVLDADGAPIKKGDTVYLLPGEWCDRFPCLGFYGGDELEVFADGEPRHVAGGVQCRDKEKGFEFRGTCYPQPSQLTHTKPEPPDSWDRWRSDLESDALGYAQDAYHGLETSIDFDGFVRRAMALAERERGE